MSTKHVRTTSDLVRFGCSITVTCDGCGATRSRLAIEIARTAGSCSLDALARRLRCTRCRAKRARIVVHSPG